MMKSNKCIAVRLVFVAVGLLLLCTAVQSVQAAPSSITFTRSADTVEAYDFVEVTLTVTRPRRARIPLPDVVVEGTFGKTGGGPRLDRDRLLRLGGRQRLPHPLHALRRRASTPIPWPTGRAASKKPRRARSRATDGHRRGPIRVDPQYPWHFIWEGTGEHYFFNGTTAFWLMGWRDERIIQDCIERLHSLKVNRMRVLLSGGTDHLLGRAGDDRRQLHDCSCVPGSRKRPDSFEHPGIDYTRFNVPYWQKFERMLRFARERDMIISVVLELRRHSVHPAPAAKTSAATSATRSRGSARSRTSPGTWATTSTASAMRSGRTRPARS